MNHDELCKLIDEQIVPMEYEAFKGLKNIAMVAIDEELRFDRCIDKIASSEPDACFYVVAHARMFDYISAKYSKNIRAVRWQGKYDDGVASAVSEMIDSVNLDAFLYFSEQEMNRRDSNLIRVARLLGEKNEKMRAFCNSIGDELYEIMNADILNQSYRVYDDMCNLLFLLD